MITIIVAASNNVILDPAEAGMATIGELATFVATSSGVRGDGFTLKVNGQIALRDEATTDLVDTDVLELIEYVAPADTDANSGDTEPQPTNPDGTLIPTPDPALIDPNVPPPVSDAPTPID